MKKLLMLAMAIVLAASGANAAVLASDTFTYPDGSLVPNGGWTNHSGTAGDLLVANGQAVVTHGVPSEDANLPFAAQSSGDVYFAFDFSVDDLGAPLAGSDYEYFAHFKDSGTFNFCARMDIVSPTGSGDFTVGIATTSGTADATWSADLSYDVVYHVVVRFSVGSNIAQLWIDPVAYTDTSILGADLADPGFTVEGFALRQSDSTENETIRVDNLIISNACQDVFADCPTVANENMTWGDVKSLY